MRMQCSLLNTVRIKTNEGQEQLRGVARRVKKKKTWNIPNTFNFAPLTPDCFCPLWPVVVKYIFTCDLKRVQKKRPWSCPSEGHQTYIRTGSAAAAFFVPSRYDSSSFPVWLTTAVYVLGVKVTSHLSGRINPSAMSPSISTQRRRHSQELLRLMN